MYRTLVILRYTFREAIIQPIFSLLLYIGAAILIVFGLLPFFTLGEDTPMFKSVGLDVILFLVLIATLFATSKSIHEEIEDRTMLTLMSKPVQRLEVIVGKYLGIVLASGLAVLVLGVVLGISTWMRIPLDHQPVLITTTLNAHDKRYLRDLRVMNIVGLLPCLYLLWLQISALAAIGVAVSTRVSLVVNLPIVIIVYIGGNLTRFLTPIWSDALGAPLAGRSFVVKGIAWLVRLVVPFLQVFDVRDLAVLGPVAVPGTQFATDATATPLSSLAIYVAVATGYALFYVIFALATALLLFHDRELGGGEE